MKNERGKYCLVLTAICWNWKICDNLHNWCYNTCTFTSVLNIIKHILLKKWEEMALSSPHIWLPLGRMSNSSQLPSWIFWEKRWEELLYEPPPYHPECPWQPELRPYNTVIAYLYHHRLSISRNFINFPQCIRRVPDDLKNANVIPVFKNGK